MSTDPSEYPVTSGPDFPGVGTGSLIETLSPGRHEAVDQGSTFCTTTIVAYEAGMRSPNRRTKSAKAGQYIHPANTLLPGKPTLLVCRVSKKQQEEHLADQERELQTFADANHLEVVGIIHHVGNGCDPYWLSRVAKLAKEKEATILAESVDRLLRSPLYHPADCPDATPNDVQFRHLMLTTQGVQLATLVDPDSPSSTVRSKQRKRGQTTQAKKGGRPKNPPQLPDEQMNLLKGVWQVYSTLPH